MKVSNIVLIIIILLQVFDLVLSRPEDDVDTSPAVKPKSPKKKKKELEADPLLVESDGRTQPKSKMKRPKSKASKPAKQPSGPKIKRPSSKNSGDTETIPDGEAKNAQVIESSTSVPDVVTTTPEPLNPWGPTSKGNYTQEGIYIEVMDKPKNCKPVSKKGDYLTTDYIGTFPNGAKFDSTYDRKQPMKYRIGDKEVISGCEIATIGMCVGELRRTIIPPKYGYGDQEYGSIPPGSTLHFEIKLVELMKDPFAIFGEMFGS